MKGELGLPASQQWVAFDPLNQSRAAAFHRAVLTPLERAGVDSWWLDYQQAIRIQIRIQIRLQIRIQIRM